MTVQCSTRLGIRGLLLHNLGMSFKPKKKTPQIQKTEIMASSPITSWQTEGETLETVVDFILGAAKSLQMVTCSLEEKL